MDARDIGQGKRKKKLNFYNKEKQFIISLGTHIIYIEVYN